MNRRTALVPLLALLIASPVPLVRGAEDANTVALRRDLTAFPAGKYELVQEYEENRKELLEKPGGNRTTTVRSKDSFTLRRVAD